jgi:hypothetical protein
VSTPESTLATSQFDIIEGGEHAATPAEQPIRSRSISTRSIDTSGYDQTELPAQKVLWRAIWGHHRLYQYWRLMVLVFAINVGFFYWASAAQPAVFASPNLLQTSLNLSIANFALGILIRQQLVINILFAIATSVPVSWPLAIRRQMGKVYHFGGLHIGGTVAGTIWFIAYLVFAIEQQNSGLSPLSIVTVLTAYSIVLLLLSMLAFAYPAWRQKYHDRFEISHRFGGWAVLLLIWLHFFLITGDLRGPTPYPEAMLKSFGFWALVVITMSIVFPWSRLQYVPIKIERPSNHVALVSFDYGVTPFAGSSTALSRSPLTEWHSFANVPAPGQSGFRLTISRAGDWTGALIDDMPSHIWVRGIPTGGVGNVDQLFKRVVWIATGSGIGPTLPHLLAKTAPAHLIWSTRDARATYGDKLVDEILNVEPNALIWDTNTRGRPDLVQLAYAGVQAFEAEAVIVISNEKLTREVVYGMESRGIPAYGAIWDS